MNGPPYSPPRCINGHVLRRDRRYVDPEVWRCAECHYEVQTPPGLYLDPRGPPLMRTCECGCGGEFELDPKHRYQRYIDGSHRQRAYRRRKR